jgi:hypothetical protein
VIYWERNWPQKIKNVAQELLWSGFHSLLMKNVNETEVKIEELPSVVMRDDIHPTLSGNE